MKQNFFNSILKFIIELISFWKKDNSDDNNEDEIDDNYQENLFKKLKKLPDSRYKPESQKMRIEMDSGDYFNIEMHHVRDHWGAPGSAACEKRINGKVSTYNANIELRHEALKDSWLADLGRKNPLRPGDPRIPKVESSHWEKWKTSGGKTMYMTHGIDLYALRVGVALANNLGVRGSPKRALSLWYKYQ